MATTWSVSLDRVRQEAPAAEALLHLCAFLDPDTTPRSLPAEHPDALPEQLATVGDALGYNRLLEVVGRYSLATLTPTTIGLHRLVQAVIRARLGPEGVSDPSVRPFRRPSRSGDALRGHRCRGGARSNPTQR